MTKSLDELSAAELFELAQRRQQEEKDRQREALKEQVAKDEIPYFSASYSAHLTDPKKSPYNFFCAPDYSTALRAGLKYLKDGWKGKGKPKVAFIYPDNGYGKAPIPAGKAYAEELGFEIVGEENVDLKAIEATTQLQPSKRAPSSWAGPISASASRAGLPGSSTGLPARPMPPASPPE